MRIYLNKFLRAHSIVLVYSYTYYGKFHEYGDPDFRQDDMVLAAEILTSSG